MATTVLLTAGKRSTGSTVEEEVRVEQLGPEKYKLLQSPGLVLGLAAGDVFERKPDGGYEILSRGKNLCIQIFLGGNLASAVEAEATDPFAELGGSLDGKDPKQLVYTVPVSATFVRVESVLRSLVSRFPTLEWFYGNVYDVADGVTPLNWW